MAIIETTDVAANELDIVTGSITATSDGTGTGTISGNGMLTFAEVTSANAAHIVVLPDPTPGRIVVLANPGGTGYEVRSSAPGSVAINGGSGASAESAMAATSTGIFICESATSWRALEVNTATVVGTEAAA